MQSAKEWMTWGAANVKTHPARASHAMRGPSMPRNAPCPPHKELPLAHSVRFLTQYHRITIRSTPILSCILSQQPVIQGTWLWSMYQHSAPLSICAHKLHTIVHCIQQNTTISLNMHQPGLVGTRCPRDAMTVPKVLRMG